MKLKPRAARRLLLLSALVVVVVAGAVAFIGVRSWQNERRTRQLRVDGMAAVAAKDDYAVVDNLGRFLRRKPEDQEAWLAFAAARERIEEPGGQHLQQALVAYSRAFALNKNDTATARKMLGLQNTLGMFPEARDLAIQLRKKVDPAQVGPDLADVLREEASARIALKAYDETLDQITNRLVTLQPGAYQPAALRTTYLLGANRRDDAVAFAQTQVAANPDDPRAAMLRQMVLISTGGQTNAADFVSVVCKAAGLDPAKPVRVAEVTYSEADFAFQLVQSLDRLGMPVHSLLVLKDAVSRLKSDDAKRLLAQRTWQAQLAGDLVKELGPTAAADPAALHVEVLAFLGLSYRDIGDTAKAKEMLAALRARERNSIAQNWANILAALLEKTEAREALTLIDASLKADPNNPVFNYFKAEMLTRLGRADEARTVWTDLYKSPAAEGWAAPAVRVAETLIDEGRLDEGLGAATDALRRSRSSPSASLVMLRAQTALIESGRTPPDPAAALAELDALMGRLASAEQGTVVAAIDSFVLPARIELLCAVGRKADAVRTLEAALSKPGALSSDLLMRLAAVNARTKLGMDDRLLASAGNAPSDSGSLFTRVLLLNSLNKRGDALKLINESLAAAAAPDAKLQIQIVRAQFLDAIGDPEALGIWKKLIADHPDSLPAYSAAIRSNAVSADLAFVDSVIAKLTSLGGSNADRPSAAVRYARCRALLYGSPTAKNRDEAVTILRAMMLESPRLEARNLLIEALLLDDPGQNIRPDFVAAAEQLTAASAVAPNRAPYTLRLAAILQRQGRARDAASELSKLAIDKAADRADRLQAIDRLSGLLESETALRAVDALLADSKDQQVGLLARRAVLLSALGRDREAVAAYKLILQRPTDDVDALLTAAAGLRALGETAAADEAVKKLNQPGIPPFMQAIGLGRLAVASGDFDAARTQFTSATELAPADARTWSALAQFSLQRGEMAQAEAAATAGLKQLPGNADLAVLLQQAKLAGQTDANADLSALADALEKTPGMQRRATAIRTIQKSQRDGKLDDAATLVRLSDEFVDDPTTQLFVNRRLMSLKPPKTAEAASIMRRAANRFPADASVQEQATRLLAGIGDWQAALVSATAWRSLTRSPQADLAVGEAHLVLGRPRPAVEAVAAIRLPAPPEIAQTDTVSLGALSVRVRGLATLATPADTKAAFQALQPYLPSATVRAIVALPIASQIVTPVEEARRWVEQIAAAAKADDRAEQLDIAAAWARLANRFPAAKADLYARAIATTDKLLASEATADVSVFEARAELLAASGDTAGAIAAARAAIAKQPDIITARLGLANLLLAAPEGVPEAAALARQAADLSPTASAPLALLARVQLRQADLRAAAGDQPGQDAAKRDAAETLKKFMALPSAEFGTLNDMAIVAERVDNLPAAITLYERALVSPQGPTSRDVAIVKNNLAYSILQQANASTDKAPLARAKQLVSESIQAEPLSSFYDTLGSIDAAMGDRAGAIAAYRRCLTLEPKSFTTVVGLAMLLADGTPEEKAEAAALVKGLDDAQGAVKGLSPARQQQLNNLRPKLAPR